MPSESREHSSHVDQRLDEVPERFEADPPPDQEIFKKLLVGPEGIARAELADEFDALLDVGLPRVIKKIPARPGPHFTRGSNLEVLVDSAGFEPATSSTSMRRSSQLSYESIANSL